MLLARNAVLTPCWVIAHSTGLMVLLTLIVTAICSDFTLTIQHDYRVKKMYMYMYLLQYQNLQYADKKNQIPPCRTGNLLGRFFILMEKEIWGRAVRSTKRKETNAVDVCLTKRKGTCVVCVCVWA